ncbi:MAG: winged helix-turn-helix transcriptional regulator [Myxococcales bacterium]|nr:winged helix-turn-helix transcriptional regulator [Myxococcales bacterium]
MATTTTAQQATKERKRTAASESVEGCCEVFYVDEDRVGRVRDAMLSDDLVEQVADTFKVLAHPTRVRILRALAKEELCVCDLAQVLGLSISATSHQLRTMRTMKLVRYRMDGKLAYYSLRDPFVVALLEDGVRHLTGEEGPG